MNSVSQIAALAGKKIGNEEYVLVPKRLLPTIVQSAATTVEQGDVEGFKTKVSSVNTINIPKKMRGRIPFNERDKLWISEVNGMLVISRRATSSKRKIQVTDF